MRTEVIQIIKASQSGDGGRALSYARLLAENLGKEGDERSANQVRRAVGDLPAAPDVNINNDLIEAAHGE